MRWAVARGTRARALSALAGVVIVGAGIAIWSAGGPDGDRTETDVPDVSTTVTGAVTEPTLDTDATAGSVSVGTDISGSTPPTSVGADGGTATPPTGGAPAVSSTRAGDGTGSTGPAAPTSSVPLSTLPPVPGSVAITSPLANDVVARTLSVQGSAGSLPAGHELWLAVRLAQGQRYVVQGDGPLSIDGGAWQATVTVGDGSSAAQGQRYLIYVIEVDRNGGDVLRSELVGSAPDGIELPPGAAKAAAVMVQLQA